MSITSLFDSVESHDLAATANLASSLRSASDNVLAAAAVLELRKALKDPDVAYLVLARVFDLTKRTTDVRYENPNDVALFVYALVLNGSHPVLAVAAAGAICQVPNLWWASAFATEIIDNRTRRNDASGETLTTTPVASDVVDRVFVTDPRWLLSPGARLSAFSVTTFTANDTLVIPTPDATTWTEEAEDTCDLGLVVA